VAVHKFTENEIAYISREVLVALDYLHDSKLAHRDLKSGNIMLDMSGAVKLST
jgi:serine/threonine protein kinase